MNVQKRVFQTLMLVAMAAAAALTARPAQATALRICSPMCAESCAVAQCEMPCLTWECNFSTCLGVNGQYYSAEVDCR